MTVEHESENLQEFVEILMRDDFIIVEEFYKNPHDGAAYSRGNVALNHRYIGKIKVITEHGRQ